MNVSNQCVVHFKLTQHCTSIIFQLKHTFPLKHTYTCTCTCNNPAREQPGGSWWRKGLESLYFSMLAACWDHTETNVGGWKWTSAGHHPGKSEQIGLGSGWGFEALRAPHVVVSCEPELTSEAWEEKIARIRWGTGTKSMGEKEQDGIKQNRKLNPNLKNVTPLENQYTWNNEHWA